jgi:primosomal protein N' (replication factor Y)
MTLHADKHQLLCHICGLKSPVPHSCPECRNPDIIHKGIGTKLVADELHKLFPKVRIARFDADNAADETLQANYQDLYDGDIQLIVGTQVIAKGLDLPNLRVVGVLQADSGLILPDYQAEERVFQLLYQVAGRVGRQADVETSVIVQTYQPNHPVIHLGLQKNYDAFYEHTIATRQQAHFPPFTHLLKLTCSYNTESGAVNAARKLAAELKSAHRNTQVLGPTPAFYERMGGKFRWQLLIKCQTRATLQTIAATVPKPWQYDLDPHSLL